MRKEQSKFWERDSDEDFSPASPGLSIDVFPTFGRRPVRASHDHKKRRRNFARIRFRRSFARAPPRRGNTPLAEKSIIPCRAFGEAKTEGNSSDTYGMATLTSPPALRIYRMSTATVLSRHRGENARISTRPRSAPV